MRKKQRQLLDGGVQSKLNVMNKGEISHETLASLCKKHPAWRLLRADSSPLVASFLYRVFIAPNVREISQVDLQEA